MVHHDDIHSMSLCTQRWQEEDLEDRCLGAEV